MVPEHLRQIDSPVPVQCPPSLEDATYCSAVTVSTDARAGAVRAVLYAETKVAERL